MKLIILVACAAALIGSTAYSMKTPATVTKTPQTSASWKTDLWRGIRNVPAVAISGGITILGAYFLCKKPDTTAGMCTLAGLALFIPAAETLYKSLSKAYTDYQVA